MKKLFPVLMCGGVAVQSAGAADLNLKLELPALTTAEYHKPYVAVWVENEDRTQIATLSVWYDLKKRDNGGAQWLKDVRQWWRRVGRDLQMPVDGVSGATRGPGEHVLSLGSNPALAKLPAGKYRIVVEAAREAGGREVLDMPFEWPVRKAQQANVKGEHELGTIALDVKP